MRAPAWTNSIPSDWAIKRLRHVAEVSNSTVDKKSYEGGDPVRLCNYTDVYYNDYITDEMAFMQATATRAEVGRFELRIGDVLITKDSESWDDIAVPACVKEPLKNVVSGYHLSLLRPMQDRMYGPFMLRALQAQGVKEQFWLAANGVTRFGLGQLRMKNALLPLPPLEVQKAIADFLDRKTATIDVLIEKKQRLLDLLAEKRSALINRAVAKGLDPNVPMKDSGIPWIGGIPAHWDVKRLKFCVREAVAGPYGASLTKAMYATSGFRVYGQQQVIPGDFTVGDYYVSAEKFAEMKRYAVQPGDVLVSVMGTVGRVAVVPDDVEPGIINPRLVRYHPDGGLLLPRYMQAAMLAEGSQSYLRLMAQGATMDGLNMATLAELPLTVPPLEEQHLIVARVRAVLAAADKLLEALQDQISRLREYRQALISAAVTGQLDITEDGEEAA